MNDKKHKLLQLSLTRHYLGADLYGLRWKRSLGIAADLLATRKFTDFNNKKAV